nr:MAG TPA: hypothetical protein [Caudoviricetes sp.]
MRASSICVCSFRLVSSNWFCIESRNSNSAS